MRLACPANLVLDSLDLIRARILRREADLRKVTDDHGLFLETLRSLAPSEFHVLSRVRVAPVANQAGHAYGAIFSARIAVVEDLDNLGLEQSGASSKQSSRLYRYTKMP